MSEITVKKTRVRMIEIIITLMVLVVAIVLLFWIKRALFVFGFFLKMLTLAMILCFVFSIWFGYQIVSDANDFKNNFSNSTNAVLVLDTLTDTGMVAGVLFNPSTKSFEPMTKEQLLYFQNSYKDGEFESINDEYYKIFLIDVQSFKEIQLPDSEYGKINLTSEEITQVMISSIPKKTLAEILSNKTSENVSAVEKQINFGDEEIKNYILTYYLSELFKPTNLAGFIIELKTEGMKVYENTALFRAVKLLPTGIISRLVN